MLGMLLALAGAAPPAEMTAGQRAALARPSSAQPAEALRLAEGLVGPIHRETAEALYRLWRHEQSRGRAKEAAAWRARMMHVEGELDPAGYWKRVEARTAIQTLFLVLGMDAGRLVRLAAAVNDEAARRALSEAGRWVESRAAANRVAVAARDLFGPSHRNFGITLGILAEECAQLGDYRAALALNERAATATREALGERHPQYALVLAALGQMHGELGGHREARALLARAADLCRAALGEGHADHGVLLALRARQEAALGAHRAALDLSRRAQAVFARLAPDPRRDAGLLGLLTELHLGMGDGEEAVRLARRALEAAERAGPSHPDHATALNNLGAALADSGDHRAAIPVLLRAATANAWARGAAHPAYARTLFNLGGSLLTAGEDGAALPLLRRAEAIHAAASGASGPQHSPYLAALAVARASRGEAEAALPLARRALALAEPLGPLHPDYATRLGTLADVYLALRRPGAALPLCETALHLTRRRVRDASFAQSGRQQLAALAASRHHLDQRLSIPDDGADAYRHVLAWKGAAFEMARRRRLFAGLRGGEAVDLAGRLAVAARLLAVAAAAPPAPGGAAERADRVRRLADEKEALERRLARLTEGWQEPPAPAGVSPPPGVALVDYLAYTAHGGGVRGERRLVAFVSRAGRPATRIDLGPAGQAEEAALTWRRDLLARRDGPSRRRLHALVWAPLRKHLAGATAVLISPDGVLGTVPFAALPGEKEGTYLIEDKAVAVVPVPRLLPEMLSRRATAAGALLAVGDVDFGKGVWAPLPATRAEADEVGRAFARRHPGGKAFELRRGGAALQAVREALPRAGVAHLATHGYFAPEGRRSALDGVGPDPLLLSGLVLSGGEVLSALEVSEMDLSRLELAVLSACETGLGKVAGGEGMLGLQRAFAVAGARSVVSSLWKVDDEATRLLMREMYGALWGGEAPSRVEALRRAQLAMLKVGVRRGVARGTVGELAPEKGETRAAPYYWAGFVLSGDWR